MPLGDRSHKFLLKRHASYDASLRVSLIRMEELDSKNRLGRSSEDSASPGALRYTLDAAPSAAQGLCVAQCMRFKRRYVNLETRSVNDGGFILMPGTPGVIVERRGWLFPGFAAMPRAPVRWRVRARCGFVLMLVTVRDSSAGRGGRPHASRWPLITDIRSNLAARKSCECHRAPEKGATNTANLRA
jgi:hypothetical protein